MSAQIAITIRPNFKHYWRGLRHNIHGAAAGTAAGFASSLAIKVVAHPSDGTAVALAAVCGVIFMGFLLPAAARIRRCVVITADRVTFTGLVRSRCIPAADIGMIVDGPGWVPDPRIRVFDTDGDRVWTLHRFYWPPDLVDVLTSLPIGRPKFFRPGA